MAIYDFRLSSSNQKH